jgi:hypothetical protein
VFCPGINEGRGPIPMSPMAVGVRLSDARVCLAPAGIWREAYIFVRRGALRVIDDDGMVLAVA